MSDSTDQLRTELLQEADEREIEVEKVVQLARIADALESIEETGVYTWPQDTEDEPERRR